VGLVLAEAMKPLPMELRFSRILTVDLAPSLPHNALKKQLSQWSTPVKPSLPLNRIDFITKLEIDPSTTSEFGLVAEDVERVDPALIVRDKNGKPYSVRYDQVNAMLLNKFLKEHKKAEGQRSRIEKQEATITELKSNLAAQTMQIQALMSAVQKVNAQVEL